MGHTYHYVTRLNIYYYHYVINKGYIGYCRPFCPPSSPPPQKKREDGDKKLWADSGFWVTLFKKLGLLLLQKLFKVRLAAANLGTQPKVGRRRTNRKSCCKLRYLSKVRPTFGDTSTSHSSNPLGVPLFACAETEDTQWRTPIYNLGSSSLQRESI